MAVAYTRVCCGLKTIVERTDAAGNIATATTTAFDAV
jgi:hypothetical protein